MNRQISSILSGETTEELIAKAKDYRVDSIVLALSRRLTKKRTDLYLKQETIVLGVEPWNEKLTTALHLFSSTPQSIRPNHRWSASRDFLSKLARITEDYIDSGNRGSAFRKTSGCDWNAQRQNQPNIEWMWWALFPMMPIRQALEWIQQNAAHSIKWAHP